MALQSLNRVVNLCMAGKVPREVASCFCGAREALQNYPSKKILLVDLINAFITLDRDTSLKEWEDH